MELYLHLHSVSWSCAKQEESLNDAQCSGNRNEHSQAQFYKLFPRKELLTQDPKSDKK
jgi:hypothetical protein